MLLFKCIAFQYQPNYLLATHTRISTEGITRKFLFPLKILMKNVIPMTAAVFAIIPNGICSHLCELKAINICNNSK